jgi:hypothetical protein
VEGEERNMKKKHEGNRKEMNNKYNKRREM